MDVKEEAIGAVPVFLFFPMEDFMITLFNSKNITARWCMYLFTAMAMCTNSHAASTGEKNDLATVWAALPLQEQQKAFCEVIRQIVKKQVRKEMRYQTSLQLVQKSNSLFWDLFSVGIIFFFLLRQTSSPQSRNGAVSQHTQT